MGYLGKFRILEKTTLSNQKRFIPQVKIYTLPETTGVLWWKKSREVEYWNGFMHEPDGTLMFDSNPHTEGAVFSTKEEAHEAIAKFKKDMQNKYDAQSNTSFTSETKIINVE